MTATAESLQLHAAREVVARLNDPETGGRYERWVERARGCRQPVRLRGASRDADAATGEVVREFTSEGEPDGVLLTPCGNRRAHVCPACSEVYRGDAWQLVVSGLRGGKGVPEIGGRASAGVRDVHGAELRAGAHDPRDGDGKRLACRPRSRGETCPHGRSLACTQAPRRRRSVPRRGDLPGLLRRTSGCALWNHNAGRLFKRTRDLRRARARPPGRPHAEGRARAGARVLRQGGGVPAPRRRALPHALAPRRPRAATSWSRRPPSFDAQLLADAITAALPKATVPAEDADADPYGWGAQHDVRALDLRGDPREAARVAGYIAKYATKSTEDAGGVRHRIEHEHELRDLRCRDHARRLITSAWQAGAREEVDGKRMRRWAHQFGFGGHCFTKSRRFSTTFKALREARADARRGRPPRARPRRKVTTT